MSNQNFVVKTGLTVGNTAVISSDGSWIGPNSGLVGATGPAGTNGTIGVDGATGPQGATGAPAPWSVITTTHTANTNQQYIANTASGAFTLTLPTSPTVGNVVRITDGYDWSANNLTLTGNGSTIENSVLDFVLDVKDVTVELIYDGSTWQVTSTLGPPGVTGATGPSGQTTRYMQIIAIDKSTALSNTTNIIGEVEIPISGTISDIRAKTTSGTANVQFLINSSNIGYVNATSTGANTTVSSVVSQYDDLTFNVSSASGYGLLLTITIT